MAQFALAATLLVRVEVQNAAHAHLRWLVLPA